jgi:hypothetical protein
MRTTINTKKVDIDLVNEWKQITGKYNWIEIHPLMMRFEKENIHGMMEIELYLLGFGVRFYWTWNKEMLETKMKEYQYKIDKGKWYELKRKLK